MDLISTLTQNLGVSESQATGGAGLLFKLAKDKLPAADFAKVTSAVPSVNGLISAAPAEGGGGMLGGLGKLAGGLGGAGGSLGTLAAAAGGFSKLGMNAGMVGKFVPIILEFVKSKGGEGVMAILQKVMK